MFETLKKPGPFLVKSATLIGGVYVVRGYMQDRLEEVRLKMEEERRARENLRTRFLQSQEDVAYTILALLPTLSSQVLKEMDIDVLTRELQVRSRARNARAHLSAAASRPPSSLASSIDVVSHPTPNRPTATSLPISAPPIHHDDANADTRSDVDSVANSSEAGSRISEAEEIYAPSVSAASTSKSAYHTAMSGSFMSDTHSVTRSWVVESTTSGTDDAEIEQSRSPVASAPSSEKGHNSETASAAGDVEGERLMSESMLSATTNTTNTTTNSETDSSDTRTKAELWNEVKMLTFTRTLTTLYSSTLLCLLTTLQLTLLARGKYVSAVLQQERQERLQEQMQERMEREMGLGNLLLRGVGGWMREKLGTSNPSDDNALEELFAGMGLDGGFSPDDDDDAEESWPKDGKFKGLGRSPWLGEISEEVESKYLTMSWWLLHVGWKDVGERVRRGVEEVFNGVSLKTKLAAVDLHRLISDVRRRVEHEITFEGTEKRTTFISSLLPPTPETIHHVLTQGGFTASNSVSPLASTSESHYHQPYHERHLSDSSMSFESSQLSYNFVNSPALAVSTHVPGPSNAVAMGEENLLFSRQSHAPRPHRPHHQTSYSRHPHHDEDQPLIYLAPPPPPTQFSLLDEPFIALIEETRSILASADFAVVLEVCLDRATEVLFEGLEKNVYGRDVPSPVVAGEGEDGGEGAVGVEVERIRLAGLLPGLARWSQLALNGLPNELVDKILNLREVSCISAITFGKFEERFPS
ncbi:hypothetical protein M413DRAFT_449317 [Hebeloma cylindrosporum]|uniref:Peroxin-3 n=1 Tax=Hebeloma cylindrosporum TaxID=76867 RepID=A0A0C3BW23_HEBCY|nr:hypothetical protein M413DRAFT_449317 [Hebeloma cylindrosporum h7]